MYFAYLKNPELYSKFPHVDNHYGLPLQIYCQDFAQHIQIQFGFIVGNKKYEMAYISADGKALIIMGGAGRVISEIGCQISALGPEVSPSMAM